MKAWPLNTLSINIHTWGGFGSQIYGLAVAKEIKKLSKKRINLILHTSGVTERHAEISSIDDRISILKRQDFSSDDSTHPGPTKVMRGRFLIKFILLKMRIILDDSNLQSNLSIKPWTLSLRGHYTQLSFSRSTLLEIGYELLIPCLPDTFEPEIDILIHYRLGDLLALESKSPVDAKTFAFLQDFPGTISVVSDSLDVAVSKLSKLFNKAIEPLVSKGGRDVVNYALNSRFFIGSSSKVSDWAILYRLLLKQDSVNYAPLSRKAILEILCKSYGAESIIFYADEPFMDSKS